jgi:hypothetical protein
LPLYFTLNSGKFEERGVANCKLQMASNELKIKNVKLKIGTDRDVCPGGSFLGRNRN